MQLGIQSTRVMHTQETTNTERLNALAIIFVDFLHTEIGGSLKQRYKS